MHQLNILNSKERKKLLERINSFYGSDFSTEGVFLRNENGELFLISRDIRSIDFEKLRIEKAGLFFGIITERNIMLSIEGSQLLGKASKNVVELSKDEEMSYLKGNTIDTDIKDGEYLLKSGDDFLGSAKARGGKILNSLPKNRRINIQI